MEHSTGIKFVTCNSFEVEFASLNSFFKDDFILRICGILSKNDFALNNISLSKFECPDTIIFGTVDS